MQRWMSSGSKTMLNPQRAEIWLIARKMISMSSLEPLFTPPVWAGHREACLPFPWWSIRFLHCWIEDQGARWFPATSALLCRSLAARTPGSPPGPGDSGGNVGLGICRKTYVSIFRQSCYILSGLFSLEEALLVTYCTLGAKTSRPE